MDTLPSVATSAELCAAGWNKTTLRSARRRGQLVRPIRGVHVVGRLADQPILRARALVAAVPAGIVSGPTAARVYGLRLSRQLPEQVSVRPGGAQPRQRPGLRVDRSDIPAEAVCERAGLRITNLPATVADLLRTLTPGEGLWVLDQALATGVSRAAVERYLRPGQRGVRTARRLLPLGDPRSESALETRLRLLWHEAGVPPPMLQKVVHDKAGRVVARLDFWWEVVRLAAEGDGREPHELPDALFRDRRRQNWLVRAGITVLRFTWADVLSRPSYVVAEVQAVLARPSVAPRPARRV